MYEKPKNVISIELYDDVDYVGYSYNRFYYFEPNAGKFNLSISCNPKDNFKDLMGNRKAIKAVIDAFKNEVFDEFGYESDEYDEEEYEVRRKEFEDLHKNEKITWGKLIRSGYEIEISGNPEEIVKFINNNPGMNSKKIVIKPDGKYNFSVTDDLSLDYFLKNINDLNNTYIKGEGNDEDVSIDAYNKTLKYIDGIVDEIKSLDMSPMEQIMYAYDIVRDRKYKYERKNQNYTASRDLTQVIFGDRIVCAGFAAIFDSICKKLGFKSNIQDLDPIRGYIGHARNVTYIKDEKYNIDGIYFFDTTWDCKKKNDDSHFNKYVFFAMNLPTVQYIDSTRSNPLRSIFDDLLRIVNKIKVDPKTINNHDISRTNTINRMIFKEQLFEPSIILKTYSNDGFICEEDIEMFKERFAGLIQLFTKKIDRETFTNLLVNVRAKEYYKNPDKYPLSTDKIVEIAKKSGKAVISREELLLRSLFGEKVLDVKQIIEENELDKKMAGVKLAKTLRLALDKKQNEDK